MAMTEQERYEKARRLRDELGTEGETVVGLIQLAQNQPDSQLEKVKSLMRPARQPNVMAPPPVESQPYLQAHQLEQQAQPQNVRPQGVKENVIAGIQGAMTPGGFSGMMQNAEAMERQRVQDLLSRAQQFRNQGVQQSQMFRQDQNAELARGQQQEQFNQRHALDEEQSRLARAKFQWEQSQPRPTQNIDPLSPEGVQARVNFENQRPKDAPAQAKPDYEWVLRGGQPVQIQKGTARPGDRPYDAVAQRQDGSNQPASPYATERADRTIQSVGELKNKIATHGRGVVGGISGLWAMLPETEARAFRASLNTLKSSIAFNELTAMREASKTGGALGNVSNVELGLLTDALGALDTAQSPEQFMEQLSKIEASVKRWKDAQAMQGAPGNGGGGPNVQRLKRTSKKTGIVEFSDDGGATWHK